MIKFIRRTAITVGAAALILCVLFVSPSPNVTVQSRPSAQDLAAAREVWQRLELTRGGPVTEVRVDGWMIPGLSALIRDAVGVDRLEADLSEGEFRGRASVPLPLGMWINASAMATGTHVGFPSFRLRVGRLPLPAAAGRLLANAARFVLRMRGAKIPPLDEVVQSFSVDRDHMAARVRLPPREALVDRAIAATSRGIDHKLVGSVFCRIAAAQRAEPVSTLPELVRRTFTNRPASNPEGNNGASFVALSLAVVGDRAEALLPQGPELRTKCPFPAGPLLLHGRADLAEHWILSAALTSLFGARAAGNLGEWKELNDSLPTGSGFSFVDLAADRAGVQTALLALTPKSAGALNESLSRATDDSMLPPALLEAPEGLSDVSFVDGFGGLDETAYREAVFKIDRTLAQQRSLAPAN